MNAAEFSPALQAKLDDQIKVLLQIASDQAIVQAVKAQNSSLPPELAAMTQDKWKAANVLDPTVRALTKNAAAEALRTKKGEVFSEAFLSDANGLKVAFLAKTTNWSHKGKAKHEVPMTGKPWQGEIEVDASSGLQQIQISVPVLDGTTPIGSLVVGLAISKLK